MKPFFHDLHTPKHGQTCSKAPLRISLCTHSVCIARSLCSGPSVLDLSHVAIMALLRNEPLPTLRVNWTSDTATVWEERLKVLCT